MIKVAGQGQPGRAGKDGTNGTAGATGPKGDTGAVGAQGPAGAIGTQGAKGDPGATGAQGMIGLTGAAGAQGAKGDPGATGAQGATGPQGAIGPAGSNASATPLGTATPKALGTAAAGTSTNASREDHVHPLPVGLLTQIATATVGETVTLSLSLGVKRYAVAVTGAAIGDRLLLALTGAPQNGTLQDAYVSTAGTVSVGLLLPTLGLGAVIAVPLAIYRVG